MTAAAPFRERVVPFTAGDGMPLNLVHVRAEAHAVVTRVAAHADAAAERGALRGERRAWGECDEELIRVTNENGLLKDQARYLVERQDTELWGADAAEPNGVVYDCVMYAPETRDFL